MRPREKKHDDCIVADPSPLGHADAPPRPRVVSSLDAVVLWGAAFAGGALNAVAGGGSFLVFPALLRLGVGPVAANATTTVVMWPGSLASVAAYREELLAERPRLVRLVAASVVGGLVGAELLLHTSDRVFARLVPFLMLFAALLLTFGTRLAARLGTGGETPSPWRAWLLGPLAQGILAIYGGYFGGGMGVVMLSILVLSGMTDIHRMNAVKTLLAVVINGVALAAFVAADALVWDKAGAMIVAAVVGGYGAARVARRLPGRWVRRVVLLVAWSMTVYFFADLAH